MTDPQQIVELGASEVTGTGSPIGSVAAGTGSTVVSMVAGKGWQTGPESPLHPDSGLHLDTAPSC